MKTKEFIKRVEELGYKIFKNNMGGNITYFTIFNSEGYKLAFVRENKLFEISIYSDNIDGKLFNLIIEYAKTPIEDREEEKKFLIKHKYLVSKANCQVNLAKNKEKNVYRVINCKVDNLVYQGQFTLNEIEEIKQKLNTDLADFELVEVEDEKV